VPTATETGISHATCHRILSDGLNITRVTQHSPVTRPTRRSFELSRWPDRQRSQRRGVSVDPQLERQSAIWKSPSSPRKRKPRQDRAKGKAMLELFVGSSGTGHVEFIPEGATVNKRRYKQTLRTTPALHTALCLSKKSCILSSDCCYTTLALHSALCLSKKSCVLSSGCCYTTLALHSALCLSKKSWRNNIPPFCHSPHTRPISHHAMWASVSGSSLPQVEPCVSSASSGCTDVG
jgi:hypothetical protein